MPGPEVLILADQDGWAVKTVHCIYLWQTRLLQVWLHAFWAVLHASHVSEVNAKLPWGTKSNLLPHLPWQYSHFLADCWRTSSSLMHHLWFREYNLKLKPSKCDFFRNEITYLAHWVLKDWVHPSNLNLEAIAECRCVPFSARLGTTEGSSKGSRELHNHSVNISLGKGPAGSQSSCHLQKEPWRHSKHWSRHAWWLLFLAFTDYTKLFLLETNASKEGLGVVLSQNQVDRWYHPVAYGSRALTSHEKDYHLTKLEFLALKWSVTEHFKEYLLYQSFVVWMDNNLLMYIMSTSNLDVTGHQWVGALAQFDFELEYQKGHDNTIGDVPFWVTSQLNPETVKSILDGVTLGTVHQAKVHDPAMVEGDLHLGQEVCVAAGHPLVEMHVTNWAKAQLVTWRPNIECSVGFAEGTEEGRFKGTSSRTCLQWRR